MVYPVISAALPKKLNESISKSKSKLPLDWIITGLNRKDPMTIGIMSNRALITIPLTAPGNFLPALWMTGVIGCSPLAISPSSYKGYSCLITSFMLLYSLSFLVICLLILECLANVSGVFNL